MNVPAVDVEALAKEIKELPLPMRIRLCADLCDAKRADIAYPILRILTDELGLAIALKKKGG